MSEFPNSIRLPAPVRITEQVWPVGALPVVTIRCITYNHVNFIRDAIDGFLMQETTFPVEIIIHDDASTDGTAEIVKDYADKHPQLFWAILQKENQWSQGIKPDRFIDPLIRGEFIALCEGDDYWITKEKLQKQVEVFEENENTFACFHDVKIQDLIRCNDTTKIISWSKDFVTTADYLFNTPTSTCSALVRKCVFSQISPHFHGLQMGDVPIWITASLLGELRWVHECMGVYRIHPGGVHSSKSQAMGYLAGLERFQRLIKILPSKYNSQLYSGTGLQAARSLNAINQESKRELVARVKELCSEVINKPSFVRSFLINYFHFTKADKKTFRSFRGAYHSLYSAAKTIGCNKIIANAIYFDILGSCVLHNKGDFLADSSAGENLELMFRVKECLKKAFAIFAKIIFYPLVKTSFALQKWKMWRVGGR